MTDKQRLALLRQTRRALQRTSRGYVQWKKDHEGGHWRDALAGLAKLEQDLQPKSSVPALGPVISGGKSILEQDLTHPTGGLDGYPAFDEAFEQAGRVVIAPEALTVTRIGGTVRRNGQPNGRSIYATGKSGILYWFGHLEGVPAVGAKIAKGKRLATISANHEVPHVHVGVNARPLIGKELVHHTNYTHGAPKVGVQLRKALG